MQIIIDRFQRVTNQQLILEGKKRQLGRVYRKPNGQQAREVRCPVCGEWSRFDEKEKIKFIQSGKWNFIKDRLKYCGKNSLCSDYQKECDEWDSIYRQDIRDQKYQALYMNLKKKGVVA